MEERRPLDPRLTEQRNPRSRRIDQLSTLEVVDLINSEDRQVAIAVGILAAIGLLVTVLRGVRERGRAPAGESGEQWLGTARPDGVDGTDLRCTLRAEPLNHPKTGVRHVLVARKVDEMRTDRVLPYRFIAAAQHAPDLEPELEHAMFRSIEGHPKLKGKTRLLVDVSGSMASI